MWTSLTGPLGCAAVAILTGTPELIALYLLWVFLSRTFHSLAIGILSGGWSPTFSFLMFYSQVIGSLIKVYATFHPAQQRWTPQKTGHASSSSRSSAVLAAMAFGMFVLIIVAAALSAIPTYGYWQTLNF